MSALSIAQALLSRPSVSPEDGGCIEYLIELLEPLGFECHTLTYGAVTNLWAIKNAKQKPLLAYLGHVDVVPAGDLTQWDSPPFEPTIRDGKLHARGSADMKGSVACFVNALALFLAKHDDHKGSIGVLITSDEESLAIDGIRRVVSDYFEPNDIFIDHCLVGEPTSEKTLGDTIKNGRRGSLNGHLTVFGKQGHIAYPHFSINPVHQIAPLLDELTKMQWDIGNEYFDPTGFQISNVQAGTGAANVIPGAIKVTFNFRYNTEHTEASLKERVNEIIQRHELNHQLDWELSGAPFLAKADGALVQACREAGTEVFGQTPQLSTSGGTSDGRFIAPMGTETIEFGGLSKTIHQANECIGLNELDQLTDLYALILQKMLCKH